MPTTQSKPLLTSSERRILLFALLAATLGKIALAYQTHGSLDVDGFVDHLLKIRELGIGAYYVRGAFNNPFNSPPPMIHVIRFWGWLSDITSLPLGFWLRLTCSFADIGSFFVIWRLAIGKYRLGISFRSLLALAIAPTSLLISGFHGNTDPIMIFFLLLCLYFVSIDMRLAGIALGLSLSIKVMPLLLIPCIVVYLLGWKNRITFLFCALLTFAALSMPYVAEDPLAIARSVFGYSSIYDQTWGWPMIASFLLPTEPTYLHPPFDVQGPHAVVVWVLKGLTVAACLALPFWISQRRSHPLQFVHTAVILAVVLFFAPGFGSQYLVWLVPFVAMLDLWPSLLYYALSSTFLVTSYVCHLYRLCLPPVLQRLVFVATWICVGVLGGLFIMALTRSDEDVQTAVAIEH